MSLLSDQQLALASQAGAYPWLTLVDDGIQGFYWSVVSVAPLRRERQINFSRTPRGNVFPMMKGLVFILQFNPKTGLPIGQFVSDQGGYDIFYDRNNIWMLRQVVNGGRIPS